MFGCPGLGGMASSGRNSLPRGALAPFAKRLKNSCEFAKPVLSLSKYSRLSFWGFPLETVEPFFQAQNL
jgi:hypothetical protein